MYKNSKIIISKRENLANYVEGFDVYNSLLLQKLKDPSLPRVAYEIRVYEYRPDLIAKDFYGSDSYTGLLFVQCARNLENFTKGSILYLIPKNNLDQLLSNLDG